MKDDPGKISVGILAGGKSSRMGQNKALIRIGNERNIDRLSKELSGFSEVIISAGSIGAYEDMGLPVVYDVHDGIGPIEGICQVLLHASEEYVFICAADMPYVSRDIVTYLSGYISSDHDCYVITDDEHIQPLCAIYSKKTLPVIAELINEGKYRLTEIFARVSTKYISLRFTSFDRKVVRNFNTGKELLELGKPFVFCVSGYSDSGKTGLIEKLINEFIKDGWSVGVIKHDGHDCYTDTPGSDTDRYIKAGAVSAAVFSGRRYMQHYIEECDVSMLIEGMGRMKAPPDAVIIEGLKGSRYPKVEIVRRGISERSECDPDSLICIATDFISPESVRCPVYGLHDIKGIFLCVKEYFFRI